MTQSLTHNHSGSEAPRDRDGGVYKIVTSRFNDVANARLVVEAGVEAVVGEQLDNVVDAKKLFPSRYSHAAHIATVSEMDVINEAEMPVARANPEDVLTSPDADIVRWEHYVKSLASTAKEVNDVINQKAA